MLTRCVQIANTVFHSCHQCDNIDRLNKYKQQITNNLQLYSCARSQHAHAIRMNWLNIITHLKEHNCDDKGDFNKFFRVCLLEICSPMILAVREHFYIHKYSTLRPNGINTSNPFGIPILT